MFPVAVVCAVSVVESAAHALEKALKRYVACRKDEAAKVQRLAAAIARGRDDTAGAGGDGAAEAGDGHEAKWTQLEQKHNDVSRGSTLGQPQFHLWSSASAHDVHD